MPYIYHAKALIILCHCLNSSDDKQLLKIICQKTLNLNYIFDLLSQKDIFILDNNKSRLITYLNEQLLKLLWEVWLNSENPPSTIFNNRFVLKFIRKHTHLLRTLNRKDLIQIKQNRKDRETNIFTQLKRDISSKYKEKIVIHEISDENEEDYSDDEGLDEETYNNLVDKYLKDYEFDYIKVLLEQIGYFYFLKN